MDIKERYKGIDTKSLLGLVERNLKCEPNGIYQKAGQEGCRDMLSEIKRRVDEMNDANEELNFRTKIYLGAIVLCTIMVIVGEFL